VWGHTDEDMEEYMSRVNHTRTNSIKAHMASIYHTLNHSIHS